MSYNEPDLIYEFNPQFIVINGIRYLKKYTKSILIDDKDRIKKCLNDQCESEKLIKDEDKIVCNSCGLHMRFERKVNYRGMYDERCSWCKSSESTYSNDRYGKIKRCLKCKSIFTAKKIDVYI